MLEVVSSILRQYQKDHGLKRVPIKTALLCPYVEERGHVDRIILQEVDYDSKGVIARVVKYSGEQPYSGQLSYAEIQYAKNQNLCWRRFAVCKEMFHCMIDHQDRDRIASVDSLKKLTDLFVADTTGLTGDFPPFEKEQTAELLALETLFPVEHRHALKLQVDNGEITHGQVAERFKIPEYYTQLAFQESYLRATTMLRGKLLDIE